MNPLNSQSPGFTPWWKRVTLQEFDCQLERNRRALGFCRGRAADLYQYQKEHIRFLEEYRERRLLLGALRTLQRIVRLHETLGPDYEWRIKGAIKLLQGKSQPRRDE